MRHFKPIMLWLVALGVIAAALLWFESDVQWKVQQNNLFLFSTLFFKQTMVEPGGLLQYLGKFFTQFFYWPWLGTVLLCGWWLLLTWITKRALSIPDRWSALALAPTVILLAMNVSLGYWVYEMKLQGYYLMPTIGTTAMMALLWLFRVAKNEWMRLMLAVMTVVAGYPLMGAYALAAALLMAVMTWSLDASQAKQGKNGSPAPFSPIKKGITSAAALAAIAGIPQLYYQWVYYQTNAINLYVTALPDFTIVDTYPAYRIPYFVLLATLAILIFLTKIIQGNKPGRWLTMGIQGVLLAGGAWCVCHYWYQNDNFHHELRMQRCIEQADWKGVVEEGEKQQGEPTRAIVMMHNLALSRLGRQCDEMYNFPKGSAKPDTELPVYMHNTAGRMIYYQYGILNECHRMCMEQGVNFGWTNELLQYLTRCALLGDERQVTRKYIDILKETLFYRSWAEHMEHLLNDREALLADAETGPVTHMLHHVDRKGSDGGYVEKYLMTILSETDADDLYFQEQAVLGAMWTRNNHDFWQRIAHYVELSPNGVIPRIFLEAACLFGTMEGRPDLEGNIDPQILKSFQGFMNQMEQCKGMSMPQMRKVLLPQYGHTYFFEYFFLKDITYF